MLQLHQFPRGFGLPNPSPFCLKLETYLRMARIPYEVKPVSDPRKAPKGKLPYITDESGATQADTRLIIARFEESGAHPLDAKLTPEQRALGRLLAPFFEDNLYWVGVWSRWVDDEGWASIKDGFFDVIPALLRPVLLPMLRRKARASTQAHGIGRHSKDEIYAMAGQNLAAASAYLGDRPYFLGDEPSTIDATAFGLLANLLWGPGPAALRAQTEAFDNLEAYCARIKARYYADLASFTAGPPIAAGGADVSASA